MSHCSLPTRWFLFTLPSRGVRCISVSVSCLSAYISKNTTSMQDLTNVSLLCQPGEKVRQSHLVTVSHVYFALEGWKVFQSLYLSVCLYLSTHMSQKTTCISFSLLVHVTSDLILLWCQNSVQYVMYFQFSGWCHVFTADIHIQTQLFNGLFSRTTWIGLP